MITMGSGGDENGCTLVGLCESSDFLHDRVPITLLENLIQAVEHDDRGAAGKAIVQPLRIDAPALGLAKVLDVIEETIHFGFVPAGEVIITEFDQQREVLMPAGEAPRPCQRLARVCRVRGRLKNAE